MSIVMANQRISADFYLMQVEALDNQARMGQFYMLRAWSTYPVLSRPISVYDACDQTVSFLYKKIGKGTEILAGLEPGDEITLQGPLGTPFPEVSGKVALVGGGVGIAPLHLAAKQLKAADEDCTIDVFLGFSDKAILLERYQKIASRLVVNVGGFITEEVDVASYDFIFTCGPQAMMAALYQRAVDAGVAERVWVSEENRMACGVGACLVCSCQTKAGNRKVCQDGPVFRGEEVFL